MSSEPIHRTGLLDRLAESRLNYWAGFALDACVAAGLVLFGGIAHEGDALALASTFGAGLVSYTFYEYAFHRWLYHGGRSPFRRLHALHHARPSAIVGAPFFFSVAVVGATFGLAWLVLPETLAAVFAGVHLAGFAAQGALHHVLHTRGGAARGRLRRHHLLHHARPDVNFGVTTRLWDRLLGTADPRRSG